MKKGILILAGILIVLSMMLHVYITQKSIEADTVAEIESRGYAAENISEISIDHSYVRKIFGYNEWRIAVKFEQEPDVFFWFTRKGGAIRFEGVSSEPMMGPEEAIAYSEKYKQGTLLDE